MAQFNAADETQVRERTRTAKDEAERNQDDLKELLKLPAFRRYVWRHVTATCGLMQSAFSTNGTLQTQAIGKQDVGRALCDEVASIDPLMLPTMWGERLQELKK